MVWTIELANLLLEIWKFEKNRKFLIEEYCQKFLLSIYARKRASNFINIKFVCCYGVIIGTHCNSVGVGVISLIVFGGEYFNSVNME